MSPNRTPQTPNIFDILIDSITTPLKHTKEKPKPSPPPQKPTTPSQSFSKPDWQKPHQGPQPTQSQKPQASKNDDFNFLTWLFFPVQSTKSTQAPTNQPKSTTTNTKTKKQVGFTSDVGNYNGKEGENSTYDDELQKLANISNEVNPGQGTTTFETPICSAKENLIFTEALKKLQAMAEDESPEQRQARIIQEFLDFFESKMDKKEFDNFQKLFSFGLYCETNSGTSNQDDIEIARDEINKFVIQIDSFHHGFTNEFSEIAKKSIDGLRKYLTNQKSSIDAKTKPPELSQSLGNFLGSIFCCNQQKSKEDFLPSSPVSTSSPVNIARSKLGATDSPTAITTFNSIDGSGSLSSGSTTKNNPRIPRVLITKPYLGTPSQNSEDGVADGMWM